ncbi:MAG TPA: hypothetical protein VK549_03105 [Acidimicrobiia bacterium]|nr:hypothetical protein [Acidimicrobiia bacterium]
MTTQLRLVEPPEPSSRPASGTTRRASKGPAKGSEQSRSRRGRSHSWATVARTGRRDGRRSAAWGDWRLDAGTRQVGRAGVAQARRALEAALEQTALEQTALEQTALEQERDRAHDHPHDHPLSEAS